MDPDEGLFPDVLLAYFAMRSAVSGSGSPAQDP